MDDRHTVPGAPGARDLDRRRSSVWTAITAFEVVLASAMVVLDLVIPTLVLLAMAGVSLAARHDRVATLGLRRHGRPHLVVAMFGFAVAWSVFQLAVTIPLADHLSGHRQDLSDFAGLQGDVGMLVGLLALSWTLAAFGEELAYRGYLQTRMRQLFRSRTAGLVVAVLVSSVLFGIAHREQGAAGVAIVAVDGIAFSVVRYHFRTLWASVLAHGFNNTIGLVAFFLVGPIHGLW